MLAGNQCVSGTWQSLHSVREDLIRVRKGGQGPMPELYHTLAPLVTEV